MVVLINFDMKNRAKVTIGVAPQKNHNFDEYHSAPYGIGGLQTNRISVNDVIMEYKDGMFPVLKPVKGNGCRDGSCYNYFCNFYMGNIPFDIC